MDLIICSRNGNDSHIARASALDQESILKLNKFFAVYWRCMDVLVVISGSKTEIVGGRRRRSLVGAMGTRRQNGHRRGRHLGKVVSRGG